MVNLHQRHEEEPPQCVPAEGKASTMEAWVYKLFKIDWY